MSGKSFFIILSKGDKVIHLRPDEVISVVTNPILFQMPQSLQKKVDAQALLSWQGSWIPVLSLEKKIQLRLDQSFKPIHFIIFKTPYLLEARNSFLREFSFLALSWSGTLQPSWIEEGMMPDTFHSIPSLIGLKLDNVP